MQVGVDLPEQGDEAAGIEGSKDEGHQQLALRAPGGEQVLPDDGADPAKEQPRGKASGTGRGFAGSGKVATLPHAQASLGGTGRGGEGGFEQVGFEPEEAP